MRGRALRLAGWIERREESSRPAETGGSAGNVRVVEMRQDLFLTCQTRLSPTGMVCYVSARRVQ